MQGRGSHVQYLPLMNAWANGQKELVEMAKNAHILEKLGLKP